MNSENSKKSKSHVLILNPICTKGGQNDSTPTLSFFVITFFLKIQSSSNFQTLIVCLLAYFDQNFDYFVGGGKKIIPNLFFVYPLF